MKVSSFILTNHFTLRNSPSIGLKSSLSIHRTSSECFHSSTGRWKSDDK